MRRGQGGHGDRHVVPGRRTGRVGHLRADLEDPGGQVVVALEPDGHLVEDLVALVVDVLGDHVGELAGQLVRPLTEVPEVGLTEAHDVDVGGEHPSLDDDVRLRALLAWSSIYGTISFELFGHFVGSVEDGDRYFDLAMGDLAGLIGL